MQPKVPEEQSYIKDTDDFLKKLRVPPNLPDNIILCTVAVAGLYSSIPYDEGLPALGKRLFK